MDVVIPAIADGVQELEILALLVRVGQHVLAEQPVLELEAGKASFELPSPATGKIEEIRVGIGDDVKVGDVVLTLETMEDRPKKCPAPASALTRTTIEDQFEDQPAERRSPARARAACVRVSPAARRRARELGVAIETLAADRHGRVTIEQIEAHAGGAPVGSAATIAATIADRSAVALLAELEPSPDWRRIPHETLHRLVDVTCLEAARKRHCDSHESGPRLTLTTFVLKACALALRQHPRMNSSLIRQGRALAVKRYVHIGLAVDTRRGADLPLLRHVDQRPLVELADELERLACAVRQNPEQCDGPTFSITNLRSFAGPTFTPLVHPGTVGALGMCRTRNEGGRTVLPISLGYDPRVNDEAAASSFMATIAELLHDPLAMLLYA